MRRVALILGISWASLAACGGGEDAAGGVGGAKTSTGAGGSPAAAGEPCKVDADCASGLCAAGVCAKACDGAVDCLPGPEWICAPIPGKTGACSCAPSGAESCNGRDDDCNGKVDDGAACPGGGACAAGACMCPPGHACGGACVDVESDPKHCGACDVACPPDAQCTSGACACSGAKTACGATCADTSNDPAHCGGCDTACAPGQPCVQGKCACMGTVCGGQCVDTSTDAMNCGSCGHDCLGMPCVMSLCAPTIAETMNEGLGVATDATDAYVSTYEGVLYRIPLGTTAASKVAMSTDSGLLHVALDASNVYSASVNQNEIIAAPKAGGVTTSIYKAAALDYLIDFVGSASHLFWAHQNGGVGSYDFASKTVTEPLLQLNAYVLATNGAYLYLVTDDGKGGVEIARSGGNGSGPLELVAAPPPGDLPYCLAADDTYVYWGDVNAGVYRAKNDGSTPMPEMIAATTAVQAIAADASGVYWIGDVDLGYLKTGSNVAGVLATKVSNMGGGPNGIALSASLVYWTTLAPNQAALFLPKP